MSRIAIIAEAWGWHQAQVTRLSPEQPVSVDGRGAPCMVLPLAAGRPWFERRNNVCLPCSFPFQHDQENYSLYSLPGAGRMSGVEEVVSVLGVGTTRGEVHQTAMVPRVHAEQEQEASAEVERWLRWGIEVVMSVYEMSPASGGNGGCRECEWQDAIGVLRNLSERQMEYSLIVELAQSRSLHQVLASLSRHPRVVLERVREQLRLDRIQQLDGGCLRDFARRPGIDVATKAGARQRLLAVNRLETADTLENRLLVWVLRELRHLGDKYVREYGREFGDAERVRNVRQLVQLVAGLEKSESISELGIGGLVHPVMPNYPLQLDARYRQVYATYKKLLRQRKLLDDLWEWQRVFWSGVARLVTYAALMALVDAGLCISCEGSSTLHLLQEGQRGRWLMRGHAPGPFLELKTHHLCYLVDSWDVDEPEQWLSQAGAFFPQALQVGRTGCDAFLHSQEGKQLLLIWFAYSSSSEAGSWERRGQTCLAAVEDFSRICGDDIKRVHGLVVSNALGAAPGKPVRQVFCRKGSGDVQVSLLRMTQSLGRHFDALQLELRQVLEELFA